MLLNIKRILTFSCVGLLYFIPSWSYTKEMSPIDLLKHVDQIHRADASFAEVEMLIQTPEWERKLKLKAWSLGTELTLIRILAPRKDKGVATLRRKHEMWNFFPKINKVIKVPPSMMGGSWMGSDFSNDDLVKQSDLAKDYKIEQEKTAKEYVLTLIPHPNTVTVWGKQVIRVDRANLMPLEQAFFDEKGEKIRLLKFMEIKEYNGRKVPSLMEMIPLNKKGHKTTIRYLNLDLGLKLEDEFFSLRTLKRGK